MTPLDPRRIGPYELLGRMTPGSTTAPYLLPPVYLARRLDDLDVPLVVKAVYPRAAEQTQLRFQREVTALESVQAPNVVRLIDSGGYDGTSFLALEYLHGLNLYEVVYDGGALSDDRSVIVGKGLLEALVACHHSGIVHRDVKPGNVIFDGSEQVTLIDFGISYRRGDDRLTQLDSVWGTPRYMSRDQLARRPPSPRDDLFAWAVTMAEVSTGRHPYDPDNDVRDGTQWARELRRKPNLTGVAPELKPLLLQVLVPVGGPPPTAEGLLKQVMSDGGGAASTQRVQANVTQELQGPLPWQPGPSGSSAEGDGGARQRPGESVEEYYRRHGDVTEVVGQPGTSVFDQTLPPDFAVDRGWESRMDALLRPCEPYLGVGYRWPVTALVAAVGLGVPSGLLLRVLLSALWP